MNILYLAHRIPFPPNKGDKIRSYHQIQYLSKHHTVYLACLADDPQDARYVEELKRYCRVVEISYRSSLKHFWHIGRALFCGQALSVGAFYSRELQQKVKTILQSVKIDHIIVFSSPMAEYVRHVKEIPKLMDFVDVDSEKWRTYASYQKFPFSLLYQLEAKRLGRYEEEIAREFEQSVFISDQEVQLFRERVKDRPITVVSNGVDLNYFHSKGKTEALGQDPVLVFTAAMDYFPNIDAAQFFCRHIFPRIRETYPEIRFDIVGRKPSHAVLKLARPGRINVTGTVTDVRPYMSNASVAVVPLRIARGVQNKILEAMATGLPVVGTANAFQGIAVGANDGIRVADDPKQFADEVVRLLNDQELQFLCGSQARKFVEKRCSWEDCGAQLEQLVRDRH